MRPPRYTGGKCSLTVLPPLTVVFRQVLPAQEEAELFSRLARRREPLVFDRHFYQPDWATLGQLSVNLMNVVREPVARTISQYYYLRSLQRWSKKAARPPWSWFDKDFESCVRDGDLECQVGGGGQDMQVTYFCGSHIQCANSTNPRVLQAAKYNLENRYSVVGITEHLNITLEVLEAYLPGFNNY